MCKSVIGAYLFVAFTAVTKAPHSFSPSLNPEYSPPEQPARFRYARARAKRRLTLREKAALSSEKCGTVAAGASVLILEELLNSSRVRVGTFMAEGVRPLGPFQGSKDQLVFTVLRPFSL